MFRLACKAAAGAAVALMLCGCGTTGNFTNYCVQCKPDANESVAVMRGVADQVASLRDQKPRVLGSDEYYLGLSLDHTDTSDTVIEFRYLVSDRHPDANGVSNFYRVYLRRYAGKDEDQEIVRLRAVLEDKIKNSACPVFERTITTYEPTKLAADDPMDWARPLMKIAAG